MRLEVDLLGRLAVRPGEAPAGPRVRALLVRLALAGGRGVAAGDLVEELWGGEPPAAELGALQSLVSRLRRALGGAHTVEQVAAGYRLALEPGDVDALRAERLVDDGRSALRADPARALTLLSEAVALLRPGPADEVSAAAAARLRDCWYAAVTGAAEAELARGAAPTDLHDLQVLRDERPLDERTGSLLVRALAVSGRPAEALAAYEKLRRALADELGLDPAPELQALQRELLAPAPVAPPRVPPPAWWTSFVGRDAELERVAELLRTGRLVTVLGPGGAGKTRLAAEAADRPGLRTSGACFVELAPVTDPAEVPPAVLAALGRREAALLDVRSARPEPEVLGALVEALAGRETLLVLDNCEHLLDAVAQLADTLLRRCPGLTVLATSREPLGIDGEALAVLPPLPVPPAGATAQEAAASPAVRLLVDRAASVQPEFTLDATTVDAVVEVVRRLDGLPLAIELAAARLRTLPVEEVAARLSDRFRLLTGGSRTALPRQRTLRSVVAWSWDLLAPAERLLAERLAVFAGTPSAATAAAVCADGELPAEDVPDLLAALVDKSLLQRVTASTPRYRVLETIREYGVERLDERGELAGLRRRHAEAFAALAAEHDARLRTGEQVRALHALRAEHDDLLAALRTLCDSGGAGDGGGPGTGHGNGDGNDGAGPDDALRLALDLAWYWQLVGRNREAGWWLQTVLDVPGGDPDLRLAVEAVRALTAMTALDRDGHAHDPRLGLPELVARLARSRPSRPVAALAVPVVLFFGGDEAGSRAELDRLVAGGDPWLAAGARAFRARIADNSGDLPAVRRDAEEALVAFRALGDRWGVASCLPLLALCRQVAGDLDGTLAALEEAERCLLELGQFDLADQVFLAVRLADLHVRRGDAAAARRVEAQGRALAAGSGSRELGAILAATGGSVARRTGDLDAARELQREADAALSSPGSSPPGFALEHGEAIVDATGAALDLEASDRAAAAARLHRAHASALASGDLPIAAAVGVVVAALAAALGQHADASRVLGAAARLRGGADATDPDVQAVVAQCVAALGEREHGRAYADGLALDVEQAQRRLDPALLTGRVQPVG